MAPRRMLAKDLCHKHLGMMVTASADGSLSLSIDGINLERNMVFVSEFDGHGELKEEVVFSAGEWIVIE